MRFAELSRMDMMVSQTEKAVERPMDRAVEQLFVEESYPTVACRLVAVAVASPE